MPTQDEKHRHGGEKHADTPATPAQEVDQAWIGRKGGSDIDVEKREKELEHQ